MTAAAPQKPVVQGWCPGALRPMMSGDGLVVRVRPRGGRLSADQAAGIAALSAQYGNGLLDLSNRANLQLRGITPAGYPALIEQLHALGCLDATPEPEAMRNIMVSPFWQQDETQSIARALKSALAAPNAPACRPSSAFPSTLHLKTSLPAPPPIFALRQQRAVF